MTTETAEHLAPTEPLGRSRTGLRVWLYCLCVLVFAMVVVGGATRLTDSGLSITEWQPIVGIVPPLSEADWQEALQKYRQIPEYQHVNKGMSLEAFKTIFWWEWGHRFLGRMIGIAFLVPFLWFWLRGHVGRPLLPKLLAMFALGGLQGALGWYMVMSGLVDRVDVSQYRLAAHLGLAVVIFGYIQWVALDLGRQGKPGPHGPASRSTVLSAAGLIALIYLQIVLGAFVAGTHAGLTHNTWPLMDGAVIPSGLGDMNPWYLNLFENPVTVQFDHRMVAYACALWAALHALAVVRRPGGEGASKEALVLLAAMLAQIALGVWTLLAHVPIGAALLHQAGAIVVFAVAVHHLHGLIPSRRGDQAFASA